MNNTLSASIQSNSIVMKVFSLAEEGEVYLVGGFIRDLLASGRQSKDIDFVVNKKHNIFAEKVAKTLGGKSIELKKELLARVVLKDQTTIDFTPMQGDICSDLRTRDFTMNALAWSPSTGIIDLVGALDDIKAKRISAIDRMNFINDPLRILRAYRFLAELDWKITPKTKGFLRELSSGLAHVAHERITLELFRALSSTAVNTALKSAFADGVLEVIISNDSNKLHHDIKLISRILKKLNNLPELEHMPGLPQGLTYAGLICLEALLLGVDGYKLSLSREIKKRVKLSSHLFEEFAGLNKAEMKDYSHMFDLFNRAGTGSLDLIILSEKWMLTDELRRFQRIDNFPLLNAEKIMNLLEIKEGPLVGRHLLKLKELEFKGELSSTHDAEVWLRYQHAI